MKLTQLIEAKFEELDPLVPKVVSQIASQCSQYLSFVRSKKRLLHRGLNVSGTKRQVIEFGAIKKRKPMSVRIKLDQWIEDFRAEHYPNIASRQRSIFCHLGSLNNIRGLKSGYGFTYLIFPSNGSKIFQSKIIDDFFDSPYYENLDQTYYYDHDNIEECEDDFHDYFSQANTTYSSLEVGMKEVVIETKKHIALSIENDTIFAEKVLGELL